MRRGAAFLVGALALALAPSALGYDEIRPEPTFLDGPVLNGENVLWLEKRGRANVELRSAASGGRGHVEHLFKAPDYRANAVWARLSVSDGRTAVTIDSSRHAKGTVPEKYGRVMHVGATSGHHRAIDLCQYELSEHAFDGNAFAFMPCHPRTDEIEVRDLGTGLTRVIPTSGTKLSLSGSFLAWVPEGGSGLIVYDWRADREVYRVSAAAAPSVGAYSLQEDGKVAFSYSEGSSRSFRLVAWAAPSTPTPTRVELPPRSEYGLVLSDDRLAFTYAPFDTTHHSSGFRTVGITALDGRPRVLAHPLRSLPGGLDFDGRRLAYRTVSCSGMRFVVQSLSEPSRGKRRPCRLKFAVAPRLTRGNRVRLKVSCEGMTADCSGRVTLQYRRRGRLRQFGGGNFKDGGAITLRPATGAAGGHLRAGLRLQARAVLRDDGWFVERRSSKVTLR